MKLPELFIACGHPELVVDGRLIAKDPKDQQELDDISTEYEAAVERVERLMQLLPGKTLSARDIAWREHEKLLDEQAEGRK